VIDILIPVLDRPQNAAVVAQSVRDATDSTYRILFLCSPGDIGQIAACQGVDADTVVVGWEPGRADYARKINYGYSVTGRRWVFQAADDLRFYPGWDAEAFRAARTKGRMVVGTNDLHNPAVKRRRHATHLLFQRAYIEEYGGGTFDGTGTVMTEAYDHQFVDTEFVETAMIRKQWVFAERSRVEHMHPYWGLAKRDSTYDKAVREAAQDLALYKQRSLAAAAERNRTRRERAGMAAEERRRRRSASR
jgi:hypothetical protein